MEVLKVSAHSRSTAVAGAIAGVIRGGSVVDVQAIGAGAVNQAVKAVAIARGYLVGDGIDIVCVPFFVEIAIDGQERTAVKFSIERRPVAMQVTPTLDALYAAHAVDGFGSDGTG